MLFWVTFSLSLFILLLLCYYMPSIYKKMYSYMLIAFLWFISAFRYRIGADYDTYVMLYFVDDNNYLLDYTDPVFKWLLFFLHSANIDYQGIFIFYATVTIVFFYKGLRYFSENENQVLIGITIFALFPSEYYWTFGLIRQMAAVSILFWGAKYIVERNLYRYILVVFLASLFHASAVIAVMFYWSAIKKIKKRTSVIITAALLILFCLNVPYKAVLIVLNLLGDILGQYANYLINMDAIIPFWWIYICLFYYIYTFGIDGGDEVKQNVLVNMSFYVMIIMLIVTETTALYRLRFYGVLFFGSLASKTIEYLSEKYRSILPYYACVLFVLLFIYTIYHLPINGIGQPNISSGNINYEFNFNIER